MKFKITIGIIIIMIGLWIWLSNLGITFIKFSRDWPVILILYGIYLMYRGFKKNKNKTLRILRKVEKREISVEEAVKKIKKK